MGAKRYSLATYVNTIICEDIIVQPIPLSLNEFKDKVLHH